MSDEFLRFLGGMAVFAWVFGVTFGVCIAHVRITETQRDIERQERR